LLPMLPNDDDSWCRFAQFEPQRQIQICLLM